MISTRYTTTGLFVGLAAIGGLSFVAARAALTDITPVLLAAFQFDIAALVMLGYATTTTTDLVPSTLAKGTESTGDGRGLYGELRKFLTGTGRMRSFDVDLL